MPIPLSQRKQKDFRPTNGIQKMKKNKALIMPLTVAALFLVIWHFAVKLSGSFIFPTPLKVATGMIELIKLGLLHKYIIASLFRVATGFSLAVFVGIPLGLLLGWFGSAFSAFNPAI